MDQKKNESGYYPSVAEINSDQHSRIVREIFSSITKEYDFLNHFLSLRRDVAWRKEAVRRMRFFATGRLLDVATGTADLAIMAGLSSPEIRVTGIDLSQEMMDAGQKKIDCKGLGNRISLMQGDALALPFPDNSFDVVSAAFGIRNMPDRLGALCEMKRVVQPGGQVMILEMSLPDKDSLLRSVYSVYLRKLMPLLCRPFSRHAEAYAYLADSVSLFPPPREFAAMMDAAGLKNIEQKSFFPGITHLHVGIK